MRLSRVSAEWSGTGTRNILPASHSAPPKTHVVAQNLPQLNVLLLKQLSSVSSLSRAADFLGCSGDAVHDDLPEELSPVGDHVVLYL
jgi:hypothetical protein